LIFDYLFLGQLAEESRTKQCPDNWWKQSNKLV